MVAHGCRKRKKLICGPEEEIVVAHGRLPSPARRNRVNLSFKGRYVLLNVGVMYLDLSV